MSDLRIEKTVEPAAQVAGDNVTYTVRFANDGPSDARSVWVSDVLPSGVRFGGMLVGPAPDVQQGNHLAWAIDMLARSGSDRRVFTATIDRDAPIVITNTAMISNDGDVFLNNNSADTTLTVQYADVYVRKEVTPTRPVVPGEVLTWTITYGNAGDGVARDVVISDVLPVGADFGGVVRSDVALIATGSAPTLTWQTAILSAGTMGEIVFTTTAKVATSETVLVRNTAEITTSTPQTVTNNERAEAVTPRIDSSMSKRVWRNPVIVGELISYTIEITNTGGAALTSVPLTDTFDMAQLGFVSSEPAPSGIAAGELRWANVGPIAVGGKTQIVVTFTAQASTHGADTLNRAQAQGEYNGTVLPVMTAQAGLRMTQAQLSINKRSADANGAPLQPGDILSYTVVVRNTGDAEAQEVIIQDILPAHMQLVPGSLLLEPNAAGEIDAGQWSVQHLTIAALSQITFTYAAVLDPVLPDQMRLVNTAILTATGRDMHNGSVLTDTAQVTDVVRSGHGLALEKWVTPMRVSPGDNVTYTLRYTLTGNEAAVNVSITDTLPAGTQFVDCAGCSHLDGQTWRWAMGTLTPTTTGQLTLTARVQESVANNSVLTNVAMLSDGGSATAQAAATISVQDSRLELSIRKVVNPARVYPGDLLTYTLTVRNNSLKAIGQAYNIQMPGASAKTIGPADPYPSVIHVSDLGQINDITVSLTGITHSYGSDMDILLVGPQGQAVMLMSDVGGIYSINGLTLFIHDGAPLLPDIDPLTMGVYRPTNYIANDGIEVLPAPAPGPPYGQQLSVFQNASANGDWKLYVVDDQKNDSGVLIQGWALTLATTQGTHTFAASSGALVSDALPAGLELVTATTGYESVSPINWRADLQANSERTYTIVARALISMPMILTNTATISSEFMESNLDNNSSAVGVQILPPRPTITATPPISYTPGSSVLLPVTITNTSDVTITNGVVTITLPKGTTLTELPPGWVEAGPGVYVVPVGVIPPGGSVTIVIPITVSPLLPPVSSLPVVIMVDDRDHPGTAENTLVIEAPVNQDVQLGLLKIGTYNSGQTVSPGDRITYTLLVTNTSGFTATNVVVRDTLPDGTTWAGVATPVAQHENNTLVWRFNRLAPYQSVQMQMVITVTRAAQTESAILNSFTATADQSAPQTSNVVVHIYQPLAVTLSRFVGALQATGGVLLQWTTSMEENSFGFDLYRSRDGLRDSAVKVTVALIPAVGRDGGAKYDFVDTSAQPEQTYTYWLVETELSGRQIDYGPVWVQTSRGIDAARHEVYLPVLMR